MGAGSGHGTSAARGRASTAFAAVVLVALAAGVFVWWRFTRPEPPPPAPLPPPEVVARALAEAEADSLALKTKWVETVPEIELDALDPATRETFVRFVNARSCECGCGYTLGACRNFDPTCPYSGPLVEALLDSIRAGHPFDLEGLRPRPGGSGG